MIKHYRALTETDAHSPGYITPTLGQCWASVRDAGPAWKQRWEKTL